MIEKDYSSTTSKGYYFLKNMQYNETLSCLNMGVYTVQCVYCF